PVCLSVPVPTRRSSDLALAPNATIIMIQYPSFLRTPCQPFMLFSLPAIRLFIHPVIQSATLRARNATNRIQCSPSTYDRTATTRSEEHTSELQSRFDLV